MSRRAEGAAGAEGAGRTGRAWRGREAGWSGSTSRAGSADRGDGVVKRSREELREQVGGMAMAFVWLVFLINPVVEILGQTEPAWLKAVQLGGLALFAAAYITGTAYALTRPDPFSDTFYPATAVAVAVSGAIFIANTAVYPGAAALGIYVVAQLVITLPPRIGYWAGGLLCAVVVGLISRLPGDGMWALGFIAVAVYVSTIGSSYFTRQSERDKRAARREATLDERERIARDVHDVLGHTLTVISLKSELANKLLDRDVERARAEIADIHQLSRQAIAEVRSTVSGLAGRQLAAELTHIEEVADDAGIALTITGSADDADPSHRILFGWVVREAMTNIVRHSGARHAWIKIGAQRIVVADDGVGFSPMSEGNGLRGLRQRVENAGGRLKVTSPGPGGRGAQIEVEL